MDATITQLNGWAAWCAVTLIGLSVVAVLGAAGYFAVVYLRLRVGTFGTAALLTRVIFHAYIAGRLDELEAPAEEGIDSVLGYLPVPDVARSIIGRVGAKSGAGLANYFLVRRLGNKAVALLRPVQR